MNKIVNILILSFLVFSCSSDLNFKQAEDVFIEPVVVSNLASFVLKADDFNLGGIEKNSFENISNFDLFNKSLVNKKLSKVEFLFEINNTIKRDFIFDLVFLDQGDSPVDTVTILVPAYNGAQKIVSKTIDFESNLDVLKNTKKVSFSIKLLPVIILPNSSTGSLKFRSAITSYFRIE